MSIERAPLHLVRDIQMIKFVKMHGPAMSISVTFRDGMSMSDKEKLTRLGYMFRIGYERLRFEERLSIVSCG